MLVNFKQRESSEVISEGIWEMKGIQCGFVQHGIGLSGNILDEVLECIKNIVR